jgi:phosphoglycolate phosphatase
MKIIFDLDGTLIDSRERLYRLFQHLVPASALTFDEYWNDKRNKIDHRTILENKFAFSEQDIALFQKNWMDQVELPEWLSFDKPFKGVTEYLSELRKQHELYLVTARQFETSVLMQLADYGWANIFTKIFVTAQKTEKTDLIKNALATGAADWFVGDTGKDIETGKSLGMQTAAVLSGFLNREILMQYEPDLIVDTVIDFNPAKDKYE